MDDTNSLYPISVTTSIGECQLLDPQGEPSGPRVRLPDGRVTALNDDGGALAELSEADIAALQAAVPSE